MFLLDTNTCIYLLNQPDGPVNRRLLSYSPNEIKLCSVVKAELLFGARRSQRVEANLQLLRRFFAPLQSLPFDDRTAEEYGVIRADLMNQGTPSGPNDLMVAAIARRHDIVLVTHNTHELGRVAGLRIDDWQEA